MAIGHFKFTQKRVNMEFNGDLLNGKWWTNILPNTIKRKAIRFRSNFVSIRLLSLAKGPFTDYVINFDRFLTKPLRNNFYSSCI